MKIGLPPNSKFTPVSIIGGTLFLLFVRAWLFLVSGYMLNEHNSKNKFLFCVMALSIMGVSDWLCWLWRRHLRAHGRKFLPELLLLPLWIDAAVVTVCIGGGVLMLLSKF